MNLLGLEIERLAHACFRLKPGRKVVYIDPYMLQTHEGADLILITHEHYDHCSLPDLAKIVKPDTVVVAAEECKAKLSQIRPKVQEIVYINPGSKVSVFDFTVEAVPAYNVDKMKNADEVYHPQKDKKCGFVLSVGGLRIYHAGDTDLIEEMSDLRNIDIALLPVSGTYVMTPDEAARAAKIIKPKIAIPMHIQAIVGTIEDAERFAQKAGCKVVII